MSGKSYFLKGKREYWVDFLSGVKLCVFAPALKMWSPPLVHLCDEGGGCSPPVARLSGWSGYSHDRNQ